MKNMKMLRPTATAFAILVGMCMTASASNAGSPGKGQTLQKSGSPAYLQGEGELTAAQRRRAAQDFVLKWGDYFQETYNQPLERWAVKQGVLIGKTSSVNVRNAMTKSTLEAASMALRGQDMTEEDVINYIATRDQKGLSGPMSLGDLAADLVFTPLAPCRIFDTRVAGGVVASGGTRSYDTYPFGSTNFAYQGGTSSGNCGMPADAAAVVLNIAAPLSTAGGFLTVYPYGTARPLASNLDYSAGELKNNEIIAKSANGSWDISIYAHGATHLVGDVVGYFIRPGATALQCVETANTVVTVAAGGQQNAIAPACAAGYTQTATNCESSTWQMPFVYFSGGTCSAQNNAASSASLRASRTCCRVPGR